MQVVDIVEIAQCRSTDALGAVVGTIIGGLFAALVVVSFFNPEFSARFGTVISMRDAANRFPPSEVPQISIIIGLLDGLLIAWTRRDPTPQHRE